MSPPNPGGGTATTMKRPERPSFAHALLHRAYVLAIKAPRDAPDLFIYVAIAAAAVLIIYGFATFNGYLLH